MLFPYSRHWIVCDMKKGYPVAAFHVPFMFHNCGEEQAQKRKRLDNQLIVKPFLQSG